MDGQQRVGVLVEVPQVLRELGKDPARIIARAGLDPDILRDPENSISFIDRIWPANRDLCRRDRM